MSAKSTADPADNAETDFPWDASITGADDDGEGVRNTPEVEGSESQLPPYIDQDVEAADDDAPPVWFGRRWREITDTTEKQEAWKHLRQWVDWLKAEYKIVDGEIPNCWYLHTDITAELYAGQCAEYKVWEEGAPGLSPLTTWHPHLVAMRGRIKGLADICNRNKKHTPDEASNGKEPFTLTHDEDQWHHHINSLVEVQLVPVPQGTTGFRFAVETEADGTLFSEPVAVSGLPRESTSEISPIQKIQTGQAGEVELRVAVMGEIPKTTWWESQLPGSDTWSEMATTKIRYKRPSSGLLDRNQDS
ncbi:hypothetical protein MB46_19590 (plasmid) [Arthrobacter alpinus]|uniref:hypothetical protein n=1 Tax=Arthrobacter alpinus TaxID=656366 RepID=UPI000679E3A3|nr:hypothetical protein [Arthrobacter alpinus]ALV47876.1 hypothetical protein MB46_19590 [Arthrobacter alpinus]